MASGREWLASYRTKLTLGYLLVVILVAGAWMWTLFGPLDQNVRKQQREELTGIARSSTVAIEESQRPLSEIAQRVVAGTALRMTVIAGDGTVLAETSPESGSGHGEGGQPEVAAALSGGTGFAQRRSATTGTDQVFVAVPATRGGRQLVVRMSAPVLTINDVAAQTRTLSLLALVATLAMALLIGWRVSAVAIAPIQELATSARRMAAGDLASSVPPADGELGELSVALSDLRDQMRERVSGLEAERRNLRTVLDGLTDAVFLLEAGRVALANDAANTLLRTPFGGWIGRALDESTLPASLAAAIGGLTEQAHGAGSRTLGPDPTGRWLRITLLCVPQSSKSQSSKSPQDNPDRTLVVISDITERMRLDTMRTDFVANASHELKTPTAAISLLAESARTAAGDGDTDQAMEFLGQISNEAKRLRRLVADLLDLSRLERAPEADTITDMRQAIDLSATSHRAAARAKDLALDQDFAAVRGQDVYVRADPTDMAVALDNLIDNAVAFTERGGVSVHVRADAANVWVDVKDTGLGIPAEDLPRVFERFYRVDRARTRDSGGTGLGLALVRHLAERAGGSVAIVSTPGTGTTVTLSLPRA